MSKPVKDMIRKELAKRFEGIESMAVVGFSGLDGTRTNEIRGRLLAKDMRMLVVKNSLARQALGDLKMSAAADLLDGPCAVVYGADNVVNIVRELLSIHREAEALTVKAALLDGEVFGADRIEELSRYPNREEAVARVMGLALAPGGRLAACMVGPGARVASLVKTVEDKQTTDDAGETGDAEDTVSAKEAGDAEEAPGAEETDSAAEKTGGDEATGDAEQDA